MHDALCVLVTTIKNHKITYGGGFSEMTMAQACDKLADSYPGKQALAIRGFATALRQIPIILCNNGGYDS